MQFLLIKAFEQKKKKEERGEIEKWGKEQQLAHTATSRANVYFNFKKTHKKQKETNKKTHTHTKKALLYFQNKAESLD